MHLSIQKLLLFGLAFVAARHGVLANWWWVNEFLFLFYCTVIHRLFIVIFQIEILFEHEYAIGREKNVHLRRIYLITRIPDFFLSEDFDEKINTSETILHIILHIIAGGLFLYHYHLIERIDPRISSFGYQYSIDHDKSSIEKEWKVTGCRKNF